MKENMLEVIKYLVNYIVTHEAISGQCDLNVLESELVELGFGHDLIHQAFAWLEDLAKLVDGRLKEFAETQHAIRIYSPDECQHLETEARGMILFLEQLGILDPENRELVIDRAMALDTHGVTAQQIKWIVFFVLLNQSDASTPAPILWEMIFPADTVKLH